MERLYFIFGKQACSAYNDNTGEEQIDEVAWQLTHGGGELHEYDPTQEDGNPVLQLLSSYSGWGEYQTIPQYEYDNFFIEYMDREVQDWTASELFNWLQSKELIDEDDDFEDWKHDRSDMVNMVRDNIGLMQS